MAIEPADVLTRRQFVKRAFGAAAAVGAGGLMLHSGTPRKYPHRKPVRCWHMLDAEWEPPMNAVIDAFNRSQNEYEIVPLLLPDDDADSKFLLSVVGADPPDVMLQWTQAISTWADAGILQPLDTLMTFAEKDYFLRNAYPLVRKSAWYKDHLYGLVQGFDLWCCYVRADHCREAGIDPDHLPTTLEELNEIGKKLNRFDKAGDLIRAGFLPQGLPQFIPSFGGSLYDPKTGRLTLKTPESLRALTFLTEERKRLGFDRVIRFNAGLSSGIGVDWPFINGALSITVDGEWRVQQVAKFAPHLDYRTIPIPPPAGGKPLASYTAPNYLVIPTGAREVSGAWEFMKFFSGLVNPVRSAEFYVGLSWMPLYPAATHAPVYETFLNKLPQYRTFLRLAESENVEGAPPVPDQLYVMDRIKEAEDLATRGTMTPEQALDHLEAQMAEERQRRKELGYVE